MSKDCPSGAWVSAKLARDVFQAMIDKRQAETNKEREAGIAYWMSKKKFFSRKNYTREEAANLHANSEGWVYSVVRHVPYLWVDVVKSAQAVMRHNGPDAKIFLSTDALRYL